MSELSKQVRALERRHDEALHLAGEVIATIYVNMLPHSAMSKQLDADTLDGLNVQVRFWRNRLDALKADSAIANEPSFYCRMCGNPCTCGGDPALA